MTKLRAAIRDPKTGKIYTGESHAHILDFWEDKDTDIHHRLRGIYVSTGCLPNAEHVGFIEANVVPTSALMTRAQCLKKWGVYDSNDVRRMK